MISLFRWLVGFVFPEIDRKPFAISIFRPEFAVKAFSYLVLIILLSACGGALISGRSVTNQMPPKEWYSTCGKYRWTYKDMNKSMRDLVDQHLLFIPSEIKAYDLAPEDFNAQFKRIMMAYAALPESVAKYNRILVYVNGGLNGVDAVKDRAANLIPCMVADDYFPVFLIWDSHWWSSYNEQKIYVRDGRFEKGFRLTIPFDYLGDIGQGLIRAPVVYFEQGTWFLNPFLSGDFRMREYATSGADLYKSDDSVSSDNNVLIDEDPKNVDVRGSVWMDGPLYWLTLPARLLSIPFVDSIGKAAWENMVRRVRNSIRHPYDFQPELVPDGGKIFFDQIRLRSPIGTGYFSRFFRELQLCRISEDLCATEPYFQSEKTLLKKNVRKKVNELLRKSEITLIGHSMGTMVLNELVRHYPFLPYKNIVYMASASSISDVDSSIIPLLIQYEEKLKSEIMRLRLEITSLAGGVASLRESRKNSQGKKKQIMKQIMEKQDYIQERTGELRKKREELMMPEKGLLRFYSLMLHPLAEKRETFLGGVAPSGSLLEWIDTMYEGPNTMFDRTFGKWRNVSVAKHLFSAVAQKRMLFKVFNLSVGERNPRTHSEFNDVKMRFWCRQFWSRKNFHWGEGDVKGTKEYDCDSF